jgi:hypothetical protein
MSEAVESVLEGASLRALAERQRKKTQDMYQI